MSLRINNIKLSLEEDLDEIRIKSAKKLKINPDEIEKLKILRESLDARKKDNIYFNYSVEVECTNSEKLAAKLKDRDVSSLEESFKQSLELGTQKLEHRPIIIGMGPAGMFAGLLLAKYGYRPIIFERGQQVEDRTKTIEHFWNSGELNIDSNVQFGEGGAGTFSDGKLTTRIKDSRCDYVLEEFVKAGAPEEIVYSGKPHIGTDILKEVVKNIREEIKSLGGEVNFNSKLENIIIKNGEVKAAVVNGNEVSSENIILAIGHSSRDTYEMLSRSGIFMSPKAFAIGVRVEHPQEFIDKAQYGKYAGHKRLRAADYRLAYTDEKLDRAVYSFCMCPGGEVVAAASEEERLVTNGMSFYKRDKDNANSALVVSVKPEDFEGNSPLRGMEFQRYYENLAYKTGGGEYLAPIQLIGDFLKDRKSKKLGSVQPSYRPGYTFSLLNNCLPNCVIDMLKMGIGQFDRRIKGFAMEDAILTGIETRTSAPVRIERNEQLQSVSARGLYPAGEGAGYAGGIISAAVDGVKIAENIIKQYSNEF